MIHDAWLRHQQARWLRPDAHRWIRHDVGRFLKPGTNPTDVFPALDRKYNPSQPRIPAGQPGGGRWTDEEGGGIGLADLSVGAEPPADLPDSIADTSSSSLAFDNEDSPIDGLRWPITDSETPQPIPNASPDDVSDNLEEIGGGGRRGGPPIEITPGQAARLAVAQARADEAISRVREVDPGWKPSVSAYQTPEGMIRAYESDAAEAQARANELAAGRALPGPYSAESIPARGPERSFTAEERAEINRIGNETGCHSCGTRDAGTISGNFVLDHQPPNILNFSGRPQRLFPQCLSCSLKQGPFVRDLR